MPKAKATKSVPKIVKPHELFVSGKTQPTEKSPDFVSLYSNNVQISLSIFDFNLTFGEITNEVRDEQNVVNQKVRVILSKEMFKILSVLFARNVEAYEKDYGEIVLIQPPRD